MTAKKSSQKKSSKKKLPSRTREVQAWFAKLDNPQKPTMLAVRDAILSTDPRISECIKWSCPTFTYQGNLVSIQPNAKKHTSLMFHTGAKIPGRHPALEGDSRLVRTMKFDGLGDVKAKRAALKAIVKAWCDDKE